MKILSWKRFRSMIRCGRSVASRVLLFVFSLALISLPNVAVAQQCNEATRDYYVDVTNNTGYTILYLYVSPADDSNWGPDLLGNEVLPEGSEMRVYICNYSSPIFDIQVEDEDGDTYTFYSIDVSREDLTVTLSDLD